MSQLKNDPTLDKIHLAKPDIILFGESHTSASDFRTFCFNRLPGLRSLGYTRLMLELAEDAERTLSDYCNDTIDYPNLLRIIRIGREKSFINSIDHEFAEAVKEWVRSGGFVSCFNSADPFESNATNSRGRDAFMFNRVRTKAQKTVCVVGQGHTFVRSKVGPEINFALNHIRDVFKPVSATNPIEMMPLHALASKYLFRTLAEMLVAKGFDVYSIAEVVPFEQLYGDITCCRAGLVFKAELDPSLLSLYMRCTAGSPIVGPRGNMAPELIHQIFDIRLNCWDAVFFNNLELNSRSSDLLAEHLN